MESDFGDSFGGVDKKKRSADSVEEINFYNNSN